MSETDEKSPLLHKTKEKNPKTTESRLAQVLNEITVEPALLLQSLALAIDQIYLTNIIIDKVCLVQYHYDAETCRNLDVGNHTTEQDRVQRVASDYNIYRHWAEYIPGIIVLIILGSWGDARGRRFPVLVSCIGCLLTALCMLANSYWWSLPPPFIYLAYLPVGLSGGFIGVSTGINAYLSAVSSTRARTSKLSVVEWMKYGCYPLGIYIADVLFQHGGYVAVYGFQVGLYVITIIYLAVRLEEPLSAGGGNGPRASVCQVLAPSRLKKTYTVTMKNYDGGGRAAVIGHILIMLFMVVIISTRNYFFLYTRKMFDWDQQDYTDWTILYFPMAALGTLTILPALSYFWRVDDCILGFLGGVSNMFFYVIFGTAPASWVLYLAAVVALCTMIPTVTSRGSLSKIVAQEDVGAIFALLAVVECSAQMFLPSLQSLIYNQTLDVYPGTLFLIMAGVTVLVCCVYVWLATRKKHT